MNTTLTLIAVASAIVLGIFIKNRKEKVNKNNPDDTYGFHLGEMTRHDIPTRFNKRDQKRNRWSGRQTKKTVEPEVPDKGEASYGKESIK